jgi:MinD-like ATPase involved in chromosome partitioning or flagellar assembly
MACPDDGMECDCTVATSTTGEASGRPVPARPAGGSTSTSAVVAVQPCRAAGAAAVAQELGCGRTEERVRQRAATVAVGAGTVAVSSADGGVGRSTLVAALGGLLALNCPGPVVAVDRTAKAWGGLVHRVGRQRPGSVWDAATHLPALTGAQLLARWAQRGPTGLLALVGEVEMRMGRRPPVTAETEPVVAALRSCCPLVLQDLPAADVRGTWRALAAAHAPVLVARAATDSLQHTRRLLCQLREVGLATVADSAVLVVMATCPTPARQIRPALRQAVGDVDALVAVPYDPGLARPAPLDPRSLHRTTQRALLEVADALLSRCTEGPQPDGGPREPCCAAHPEPAS